MASALVDWNVLKTFAWQVLVGAATLLRTARRRKSGRSAHGSGGGGEDHSGKIVGFTARLGLRRRGRLSLRDEYRKDAERDSADRRGSCALAGGAANAGLELDCNREKCRARLFGVEANLPRSIARRTRSLPRLLTSSSRGAAAAAARAPRTLHDRSHAREPTGYARRAAGRACD